MTHPDHSTPRQQVGLHRVGVKVCGLRTPEHVRFACEAGAAAVGFVLAPSVREVTPELAAQLCSHARDGVLRVAVFRRLDVAPLTRVLEHLPITHVQADWVDEPIFDEALASAARPGTLPPVAFLPVFRDVPTLRIDLPNELVARPNPRLILLEGPDSGTGRQPDWQRLRRALDASPHPRVALAGGLNATNAASAIEFLRPAMLDVSSGVESSPGVKDEKLIERFIAVASSAFALATPAPSNRATP